MIFNTYTIYNNVVWSFDFERILYVQWSYPTYIRHQYCDVHSHKSKFTEQTHIYVNRFLYQYFLQNNIYRCCFLIIYWQWPIKHHQIRIDSITSPYEFEIIRVKLYILNLINVYIYPNIKLDTSVTDIHVSIQLHQICIEKYNSVK